MADQALRCTFLLTVTVSLILVTVCTDEAGTVSSSITHNLTWNENVSTLYPPSSPLKVKLGDKLNISCPPNGTSNVWIQTDLRQYEMCDCNATGVEAPDCRATTTTRQVCQDEVHISMTLNSNDLASALSFEPGTYYLISYSPGNRPLAGYLVNNKGGECLNGYKMAMIVRTQAEAVQTTTMPPTPMTTLTATQLMTTDNEDLSTTGTEGDLGNYSLETATPQPPTTLQLSLDIDHNTIIISATGFAFCATVVLIIIVLIASFMFYRYRHKRTQSWNIPGTPNVYVTNKTEGYGYDLYDHPRKTEYKPGMIENFVPDGTSTFKASVKENDMAYSTTVQNMSENVVYDTIPNRIPVHENSAYGASSDLKDDGPVYDRVD